MALGSRTHFFPSNSRTNFFSGFGGRVIAGPGPTSDIALDVPPTVIPGTTLLWVKSWSCEISAEVFGADTFENPMNSRGKPFKLKDLVGLASGKVDLEGFTQVGGNLIAFGEIYGLELILGGVSAGLYRRIRVYGVCSSVGRSAAADGNSPIEFKASFEFASPPNFMTS